jgi:transposase-like protein
MDHAQEDRRQQAMARYLAGDKIEVICRDLHCAKSWLYKWKARYQADNPAWATRRSTQPQRKPSQTPQPVVERILTLSQTLEQQGKQGKAAAIHQELTQQGIEPLPSRRTIYRIIQRHEQENR